MPWTILKKISNMLQYIIIHTWNLWKISSNCVWVMIIDVGDLYWSVGQKGDMVGCCNFGISYGSPFDHIFIQFGGGSHLAILIRLYPLSQNNSKTTHRQIFTKISRPKLQIFFYITCKGESLCGSFNVWNFTKLWGRITQKPFILSSCESPKFYNISERSNQWWNSMDEFVHV